MKRIVYLLLIAATALSLFCGCSKESEPEISEDPAYIAAIALLEEGKTEEAYKALYAMEGNESAAAKLKDFKVLYSKEEEHTPYDISSIEYVYDQYGNIVKSTSTKPGITNITEYSYTYENDRPIERVLVNSDSSGDFRMKYYYDSYGNLCRRENISNGEVVGYHDFKYDEKGILRKEEDLSYVPSSMKETRTYDEKGRPLTVIYGDHTSYRNSEGVYEYTDNENGYTAAYSYNGTTSSTLSYDKDGNILSEDHFADKVKINYRYNEQGQLVNKDYISENSKLKSYNESYEYNEKGKIVRAETVYEDYTDVAVYTYDEWGNLLKHSYTKGINNYYTEYSGYVYIYCPQQ